MNHLTDGHQAYPSSSQDVHHNHRPNPAHNHDMFGPSQRMAGRNAKPIAYPSNIHIQCDTGMFAGRTIRAEVKEIQKANVGRKCVFSRRASSATQPDYSHLSKLNITTPLRRYAASKDRRALDPPPVTELRIYDIRHTGNGMFQETEVDYR